jgi:hypothetical protein
MAAPGVRVAGGSLVLPDSLLPTWVASIGLALSLGLHVHSATAAPDEPEFDVFSEAGETPELGAGPPDFGSIFFAVHQLVSAFDIREGEILVQAIIIIERLVQRSRQVLHASNWRPILVISVTLSVKQIFDEVTIDIAQRLHGVGFSGFYGRRLMQLEGALLTACGWNIETSRQTFAVYARELSALVSSQLEAIETVAPQLIEVARRLPDTPDTILPEDRRQREGGRRERARRGGERARLLEVTAIRMLATQ